MNFTGFYEENNVYYAINCIDSNNLVGIYFGSVDDNIYKTKLDCGDGTSVNATLNASFYNKNYSSLFTGKIKIYNNSKKVINVNLNIGTSTYNAITAPTGSIKNYEVSPTILDYFSNAESFFCTHYCFGSNDTNLWKGKITGEWAVKCGNKLKSLEIPNADYPNSNPTFDLGLIPTDSVLENLKLGSSATTNNGYITVTGSLNNLPSTCKIAYLGSDKSGTSNSVSGIIPDWIEEFQRIGRNTIPGNIGNLSNNLRYLRVEGSNTMTGLLVNFPYLTYLYLSGQNTISGNLSNLTVATYIQVAGMNQISSNIPNMPEVLTLIISGNNTLTGIVGNLPKCTSFSISGNNTLTGILNLPEALSISVSGQNSINEVTAPKCTSLGLTGQNTISGDLFTKVNSNATLIQVAGNNTINQVSGIFTKVNNLNLSGNNTVGGDLLSKIPAAVTITIAGNNTVDSYTSRSFPPTMTLLILTGNNTLTTAMVDQLLIDLSASNWGGTTPRVTIRGNSQPPSSASASARTMLSNKGVTLSLNS